MKIGSNIFSKSRAMKILKNNLVLVFLFIGMFFFRTAVADWSPVPSSSMEPTILPGDVLLVNKTILGPAIPFTHSRLFSYGSPKRGDIITFYPPHLDIQYVKRVIGVPGDTIRTAGLNVYVNDELLPLELDFSKEADGLVTGIETINGISHEIMVNTSRGIKEVQASIIVPNNSYFVMGDYRNNSEDSRYWGFVAEDKILGKVTRVMVSVAEERAFKDKFAFDLYRN